MIVFSICEYSFFNDSSLVWIAFLSAMRGILTRSCQPFHPVPLSPEEEGMLGNDQQKETA
jgi:hypothetical protein